MRHPPETLDGASVLRFADLAGSRATGFTRHYLDNESAPAFSALAIAQYAGAQAEYYLFYCDDDWTVITDTCHDSIEAAVHQADLEFERVNWSS